MADPQLRIAFLAKDRTISTQPPEPGVGTPPRDPSRSVDVVLIEIAKIQSDGEYLKRDLGEVRGDMRDIRDRMARLEVRVDHLPTKGFIVGAVIASLTIIGALLAIAPKLQSAAGMAPVTQQQQVPSPPVTAPIRPPPQSN
jgi:hypothetical protein